VVEHRYLWHWRPDDTLRGVSRNGKHSPSRPRIELRQSSATPEEAAAIAAAIEQFLRDTAPPATRPGPELNRWLRAALFEGVGRDPAGLSSWGDAEPWGR
jgi:hypothetical protein